MRIYALSTLSKEAALFHADNYLRTALLSSAKILSDAAHYARKDDPIKPITKGNGERMWILDGGAMLLPPSGTLGPWAKWVATNHQNAWWLMDFAWNLNSEIKYRFGGADLPAYMKFQDWNLKGIMKLFKKPDMAVTDEFPLVVPQEWLKNVGDISRWSVVDLYRKNYIDERKSRKKYTSRTLPFFMEAGYNLDAVPF
jgi:hypothetical protein